MSNYLPLSTTDSNSNTTTTAYDPKNERIKTKSSARLRFIILRFFLPFFCLTTFVIGLIIASGFAPEQLGITQCQDGCIRWEKVQDLANKWATGFKNTFVDRPNKLNVLHLIDKDTSEVLMDRWFLHSYDAFSARPDIILTSKIWGPDFEGYQNSLTLSKNIENQFGSSDFFDAVLVYFNNDQVKFLHIDPKPWFQQIKELSSQGKGVVIIDRPHEMRDMRKEEFYSLANVSLVLAPYAYELFEYRKKFGTQALLVHQPHFIDAKIFYHPTTDTRPEDIIIAGDLGSFYPFRARLAEMIRNKTIPGWIRGHPGYEDIKNPKDRDPSITANKQEQQLIEFGNDFGKAKICLVTDSRWGYSVQKYVEAAAAGCLIIGNIPYDRQSQFKQVIVPLSNKDSKQTIINTIHYWLDHENERLEKAKKAQDWILGKFGMNEYVADVWKLIWLVKGAQRGLILPYEFEFAPKELPMDG
ncbi:hypothetical protein CROQUDRAFT_664417 [Cronartium quercuum f. sp. fusiforme G11]|uniref:Uncharacterized protein n=1 Tax=Cronartium quercuum f. sp. fusiforme G11 TaxID=708437 RepID=A0A9P6N8K9_9BASI|nr:hypothetical protein CROQUDRAFT_664417 [Cronartium quercuum f. sp. fusiforme G11]